MFFLKEMLMRKKYMRRVVCWVYILYANENEIHLMFQYEKKSHRKTEIDYIPIICNINIQLFSNYNPILIMKRFERVNCLGEKITP